jgi:hypothetical protein
MFNTGLRGVSHASLARTSGLFILAAASCAVSAMCIIISGAALFCPGDRVVAMLSGALVALLAECAMFLGVMCAGPASADA